MPMTADGVGFQAGRQHAALEPGVPVRITGFVPQILEYTGVSTEIGTQACVETHARTV